MATHERMEPMLDKMVKNLRDNLMEVHSARVDATRPKVLSQDSENTLRKTLRQEHFVTLVQLGIDHVGTGKRNSVVKSHHAADFFLASE